MRALNIFQIDYVEFYVANAFQSAIFYKEVLGFTIIGINNPNFGIANQISYILQQGNIRLILTSSFDKKSSIYKHVMLHGDSVKDIAFTTNNLSEDFSFVQHNGGKFLLPPSIIQDETHSLRTFSIATCCGDITHSFIERSIENWFIPGYLPLNICSNTTVGFIDIDHIALALPRDNLPIGISFYQNVLGFHKSHEEDVFLDKGGMKSAVVSSESSVIKFPLVSPMGELNLSQIDKYLNYNNGPGVQHIAFLSDDILHSTQILKNNGIQFLEVPDSYYASLSLDMIAYLKHKIDNIKKLQILLDGAPNHILMQIFSKPILTLPTFFIEVIQRYSHYGFGSGNIKALFEAVARDQEKQQV